MGKETEVLEALKESLAMMSSFHLNAFLDNPTQEDRPPEVRCTDMWIEHCTGCAAANQYRKAEKLLAARCKHAVEINRKNKWDGDSEYSGAITFNPSTILALLSELEAAEKVANAAVLFCDTEDAQADFAELEGSESIPAEYILLGRACKEFKSRAALAAEGGK